jgi:hypothetical protein
LGRRNKQKNNRGNGTSRKSKNTPNDPRVINLSRIDLFVGKIYQMCENPFVYMCDFPTMDITHIQENYISFPRNNMLKKEVLLNDYTLNGRVFDKLPDEEYIVSLLVDLRVFFRSELKYTSIASSIKFICQQLLKGDFIQTQDFNTYISLLDMLVKTLNVLFLPEEKRSLSRPNFDDIHALRKELQNEVKKLPDDCPYKLDLIFATTWHSAKSFATTENGIHIESLSDSGAMATKLELAYSYMYLDVIHTNIDEPIYISKNRGDINLIGDSDYRLYEAAVFFASLSCECVLRMHAVLQELEKKCGGFEGIVHKLGL